MTTKVCRGLWSLADAQIRYNFSEALDYGTVKGFPASIILAG
jgi:hypothetical protein